jgi:type VI secretion system secreted protein VgrG
LSDVPTQENRLISIATTLGKDKLLLYRFDGNEGISRLFHFDLYMHSLQRDISFKDIVGKKATVTLVLPDGQKRYINGLISSFSQGGSSPLTGGEKPVNFTHYHATLVPWLWVLTRSTDCRIFQDLSVPDIIQKVFQEHGFKDFRLKLSGSYNPREYCVQYRETDFNFVTRLMEEEGIFYFFEHTEDKHTLVIADNVAAFSPCPLQKKVSYKSIKGQDRDEDVINNWQLGEEVRPGMYSLIDFDFEKPNVDLTASVEGKDERKLEIYDFPGKYKNKSDGEKLVGIRMHEEETPQTVITGSGTCRGFIPGFRFQLDNHYRKDFNKEYTLTFVQMSCDQGDNYRSQSDHSSDINFVSHFNCIPYPTPFRPPRTTIVPTVRGTQTAIVVGPAGEEIYVDKYGRVKVQFHWDRDGKYNEKSSCWIRVAQVWAGKNWGAMFIPRVGQEVIVDFIEGDPDRPIIIGRVYNGASMPPYSLPDEKTKSTIKSLSSKGGGGFNEFRFEDKKGEEQIFIHAERNKDIRVKKDLFETVLGNAHHLVGGDQFEKVSGDKHDQVVGDHNEKVDGTVSLKVGADLQEKVGGSYAHDAGQEIHLKAGMKVVIESGMELTLKAGSNFIKIDPSGITIQGSPFVKINSGGAAGSGSGSSPDTPKDPQEADKAEPGSMAEVPPKKKPQKPKIYSPGALVLKQAAENGTPFCEICEKMAREREANK